LYFGLLLALYPPHNCAEATLLFLCNPPLHSCKLDIRGLCVFYKTISVGQDVNFTEILMNCLSHSIFTILIKNMYYFCTQNQHYDRYIARFIHGCCSTLKSTANSHETSREGNPNYPALALPICPRSSHMFLPFLSPCVHVPICSGTGQSTYRHPDKNK
jgi:hypothetical protein